MNVNIPYFSSNVKDINEAFRIAVADVVTNILPFKDGLLEEAKPCIIAGLGYVTPWTRDAAINTWNAGGILFPDIALNTLYSVLTEFDDGLRIDGEYWDAIIWATGAWWQYIYTGDKELLKKAFIATKNSLKYFEDTEFDEELNLFRGGACYGDGIAAYPDKYGITNGSGVTSFIEQHPEYKYPKGVGVPFMCLSTNCLYYNAYHLVNIMAKELGEKCEEIYDKKADAMKEAINKHFWMEDKGTYRYIVDTVLGNCDVQEGLGISFVILFDIADDGKKQKVLENAKVTKQGIACVYPSFPRYDTPDGMGFGRHCGTVWPHVQGFFADCASENGRNDLMEFELKKLAEHACRDSHFAEIYHPITGEIYGGRQEHWTDGFYIREWLSEKRQTWSATAYLRIILKDIAGMKFTTKGIEFKPNMVAGIDNFVLKFIKYRDMELDISVNGTGEIKSFKLNGEIKDKPFVPCDSRGKVKIEIELG